MRVLTNDLCVLFKVWKFPGVTRLLCILITYTWCNMLHSCHDCVTILGCKRSHWEHLGSSSREALLKPRCLRQAMKFIFQRWNTSCVHNSGELCLEVSQSIDSCLHIISMSFDFIKTFVNMLSEVLWVLLTICPEIIMVSKIWYYMVLYGKQDLFLFSH